MTPIKRFLIVCLAALLAPLILGFEHLHIARNLDEGINFFQVLERRIRDFGQSIKEPKIIFIGGSSTLMAVNAERFARELGRPVVNYGLGVGIPAEEIARRASDLISPGDLVVFAPEHVYFGRSSPRRHIKSTEPSRSSVAWTLPRAEARCANLLGYVDYLTHSLMRMEICGFRLPVQPRRPHMGDPLLGLMYLTPQGQMTFPRPHRLAEASFVRFKRPLISEIDLGNSTGGRAHDLLHRICQERNATLAVMPPARVCESDKRHDVILDIEKMWIERARNKGTLILLEAGTTTLDIHYGFDSEYHVNDSGAERIARLILPALKQRIAHVGGHQR